MSELLDMQAMASAAGPDGMAGGEPTEIKKRSVVIAGHRTSISLENVFWDSLRAFALERDLSVNQLVSAIDRDRTGNLSSAIRSYVLLAALQRSRVSPEKTTRVFDDAFAPKTIG